jgi:hypothetical protein
VGTAAAWLSLRLPSVVDFTRDALDERNERYERSATLHHAMPHHERASLSFPPRVLRANNDEITLLGANLSFQMLVYCTPYCPSHLK